MRSTRKILSLLPLLLVLLLFASTAFAEGEADAEVPSRFYQTIWSLLPAVIAIGLALITKILSARKTASRKSWVTRMIVTRWTA